MLGDTYLTTEGRAILTRVWRRTREMERRAITVAKRIWNEGSPCPAWLKRVADLGDMTSGRTHPVNVDAAAWYEVCREQLDREGGA